MAKIWFWVSSFISHVFPGIGNFLLICCILDPQKVSPCFKGTLDSQASSWGLGRGGAVRVPEIPEVRVCSSFTRKRAPAPHSEKKIKKSGLFKAKISAGLLGWPQAEVLRTGTRSAPGSCRSAQLIPGFSTNQDCLDNQQNINLRCLHPLNCHHFLDNSCRFNLLLWPIQASSHNFPPKKGD